MSRDGKIKACLLQATNDDGFSITLDSVSATAANIVIKLMCEVTVRLATPHTAHCTYIVVSDDNGDKDDNDWRCLRLSVCIESLDMHFLKATNTFKTHRRRIPEMEPAQDFWHMTRPDQSLSVV